VVFGQSKDKTRFQNDLGFVLSQGLTPFTLGNWEDEHRNENKSAYLGRYS